MVLSPGTEGKQLFLAQQKPSAMPRKGSSNFPTLGVPDCEPGLPIFPEGHYLPCKASFRSSVVINAEILSQGNAFSCSVQRKRSAICSGSVRKRGEVALSLFMCPLLAKNIQVLECWRYHHRKKWMVGRMLGSDQENKPLGPS